MVTDIFGPIVTGVDVVTAVVGHLKLWTPDYLAEVAEHSGRNRGELPAFRSYPKMIDLDKFNEDQVPACVVIAPGTAETPVQRTKQYQVEWAVGIGCVVSGQDDENTYELMTLYAAAVRMLMVQHPSLGGFASGVTWVSERYDALPSLDERSLGAAVMQFNVGVDKVTDPTQGPVEPSVDPTQPPGVWPTVETSHIEMTRS